MSPGRPCGSSSARAQGCHGADGAACRQAGLVDLVLVEHKDVMGQMELHGHCKGALVA